VPENIASIVLFASAHLRSVAAFARMRDFGRDTRILANAVTCRFSAHAAQIDYLLKLSF
jgi:hypothetical protein